MTRETYIIRPEEIVKTRMEVNELSGSRRVIAHGTMSPELGAQGIDAMRAQAEKLKIEAWKGYPGPAARSERQRAGGWTTRRSATRPSSSRGS